MSALTQALDDAGCELVETLCFPDDGAPSVDDLTSRQIDMLVTFGGDGTTSAVVTNAFGWDGAVLVLPGGTMNLLARRMHGDATPQEIVRRLHAGGIVKKVRPRIIRSRHGYGLTGVLAGPGTVWNDVREAMRNTDVVDFVTSTTEAIAWSANGPKVVCMNVDAKRDDGYSAITINPHEDGLEANGYHAETIGDYASQGVALLQRDFRGGPHDYLGRHPELRLACPDGAPMGLLIDGEPFDGAEQESFELMLCEVDLLATADAR